jgi:phytol kinase
MSPTYALVFSYLFVFLVIILATVLQKVFGMSNNFSRKFIHVGVGNWVVVAMFLFDNLWLVLIPPASFILLNYLSYRFSLVKAMELEGKNPGTIYYAVSLTILTWLTFNAAPFKVLPFVGMLTMTWGDGMAAVIGQKWPTQVIKSGRTISGTAAFVGFTLVAVSIYLHLTSDFSTGLILAISVVAGVAGAVIELVSPRNLDNLTVPLIVGIGGLIFEMFWL